MSAHPSLDYLAAATAQKIIDITDKKVKARDLENLVTKALGVLQSQGVYAMALFLFSRSGQETRCNNMKGEQRIAVQILAELLSLIGNHGLEKLITPGPEAVSFNGNVAPCIENSESEKEKSINAQKDKILSSFASLTEDLDSLLLVRDLFEQTLIYTRYLAKASQEDEEKAREESGGGGDGG